MPDPPPSSSETQRQDSLADDGIGSPTGPILSARNKAVNWKVLKQQWENYSIVAQLERQREEYRVALFLYSIGPAAVKI